MVFLRFWIIIGLVMLQAPIVFSSDQKPLNHLYKDVAASQISFTEEFSKYVTDLLEEWKVPGLSIAVVDGDDVYAKGYGFSVLPDTPATPETLWFGGSTTKAYLGATLAHLISNNSSAALEDGWNTKLSSILREDFVLQDEWATNHLTLEDAASHRTGVPRHDISWGRIKDGKKVTLQDTVRNLRNLPLTGLPRVTTQYCNLMYVTLSYVVEIATGKQLGDVFKEIIWGPLGMHSTYLNLQDAKDAGEKIAMGYWWDEKAGRYKETVDTLQESSGAGGIVSNVLDYAKWLKCLIYQTKPFSNLTHHDIRKPRSLFTPAPERGMDVLLYGLGWLRTVFHNEIMYVHNGGTLGFSTDVFWLPNVRYAIVVFGNNAGTASAVQTLLTRKLIEDKLDVPLNKRLDMSEILRKDVEDARDQLKNAVDILYGDRAIPPIPPTKSTSQLVGTFYDPGYGTIRLSEESDPEYPESTILVAFREGMMMEFDLLLRHVSGDYWIVYNSLKNGPPEMTSFAAAEFKFGVNGMVAGLDITWDREQPGLKEVKISFNRIA